MAPAPRSPRPRRDGARAARPGPLDELFTSILADPVRDRCPLARPVVSFALDDADPYLRSIETAAVRAVSLERRGAYHGEWAELDPLRLPQHLRGELEPDPDAYEAELTRRWHAARPIVLHGVLRPLLAPFAADVDERDALRESLSHEGGLRRFLDEHASVLEPSFRALAKRTTLVDKERDVERVLLESFAPNGRGRPIEDLWLKSSWLSTHEDDASLRLRFSFGSERDDDASRDILRHRLVAEIAARLLPECATVTEHPALVPLVERLCGESVLFTQHIAYWNAPNGGALFHHDAFAEDELDGGSWRQFGVCYAQLTGATAWLALSTEDLADRVVEFHTALTEGETPWVRAQLLDGPRAAIPGGAERVLALVKDRERLVSELALPGQGCLGPLVNRGPEFTSFLADAGHAFVLEAGDVILLPNHGPRATCMHSVFCASDETAYSLSLAVRPDRESPEDLEARAERGRRGGSHGRSTQDRA